MQLRTAKSLCGFHLFQKVRLKRLTLDPRYHLIDLSIQRIIHLCVSQQRQAIVKHRAKGKPSAFLIKSYRYGCVWRKARRINRFRAFSSQDFFF